MDVIRRPYRTLARFNRNSDETATINWYVVPPENGVLGIPSPINTQAWRAEKWSKTGVGEVFNAPRVFDGWTRIVVPPTSHLCGTAEDFRLGGIRDTSLPPFPRSVTGIPECCHRFGGLVLGGTGEVSRGALIIGGTGEVPFQQGWVSCGIGPPVIATGDPVWITEDPTIPSVGPWITVNGLTAGRNWRFRFNFLAAVNTLRIFGAHCPPGSPWTHGPVFPGAGVYDFDRFIGVGDGPAAMIRVDMFAPPYPWSIQLIDLGP